MTEQAQAQPSMMDAMRGMWDTCPMFKELRTHAPVMHIPELDAWILSRYDDVLSVVRDSERFAAMPADLVGEVPEEVRPMLPHGYAPWQPALINTDPPEHDRIKRLAAKPLTPAAVAKLEGQIREAATDLIDPLVGRGRADLVDEFATPMPVQVLIKVLGLSNDDYRQFHRWTLGITELFVPTISAERRLELAREQVEFNQFLLDAIAARHKEPGDDLISGLILSKEKNEKSLTDREILGIVGQLVIAGFETSAGAISFSLYKLCEQPELLARVRDDLTLVPKVVEESLRRLTPARGIVRQAKQDVEFHGELIPKGSNIFALVQSANNDESKFNSPERFDIDRPAAEMRNSMHFGGGIHACIGQSVARLDARVAIETAITRLPNLRVVPDQEIRVQEGMIFHRPERLEFEWDV